MTIQPGMKFGRYTVICLSERRGSRNQKLWVCECDCGQIKEVYLAELMLQRLGGNGCEIQFQESTDFSETEYLDVDSSLANRTLGWSPLLSFEETVEFTANWYLEDSKNSNMREYSIGQIEQFCAVESNWLSNLTP